MTLMLQFRSSNRNGVLVTSGVIDGITATLTHEQLELARSVVTRRLLQSDIAWLTTKILREQAVFLYLRCPEALKFTVDMTPTPGFEGIKKTALIQEKAFWVQYIRSTSEVITAVNNGTSK